MDGLDLPIELLEQYIAEKYYGGKPVGLISRGDLDNGSLEVTYETLDEPTSVIMDIVLSSEEIKGLVQRVKESQ